MKALLLDKVQQLEENSIPLRLAEIPKPKPEIDEVLIKVKVCGVCHTELDEIEGRTPPAIFPMVLGHQVVGQVVDTGSNVNDFSIDDRVGVAWIFSSCGACAFCHNGMENLCEEFMATGRDANGGYAEYMTAPARSVYKIPDFFSDVEAAPLLCAGAVGYRSLRLANIKNGDYLGLTGFGASAHLVLKLVKNQFPDTKIFVFARRAEERNFAMHLGASWSGEIGEASPVKLKAIIDTTPVWKPIVEALENLTRGGRLVINAIRKEEVDKDYLQNLIYKKHLWHEKEIKSVANVTALDVEEFLLAAAKACIKPHVQIYEFEDANKALLDMKFRKIKGAKVLIIQS